MHVCIAVAGDIPVMVLILATIGIANLYRVVAAVVSERSGTKSVDGIEGVIAGPDEPSGQFAGLYRGNILRHGCRALHTAGYLPVLDPDHGSVRLAEKGSKSYKRCEGRHFGTYVELPRARNLRFGFVRRNSRIGAARDAGLYFEG